MSLVIFNILYSTSIFGVALFSPLFTILAGGLAVEMPKVVAIVKKSVAEGQEDEALLFMMWAFLIAGATVAGWLGNNLWGCLSAGMVFCNVPHSHHIWSNRLKGITVWMSRIFFACTVAFTIDPDEFIRFEVFIGGMLLSAVVCFCFWFVGVISSSGAPWGFGWGMAGKAELAFFFAEKAKSSNMMSKQAYAIVIWALLFTIGVASFRFRLSLARHVQDAEEWEAKEAEIAAFLAALAEEADGAPAASLEEASFRGSECEVQGQVIGSTTASQIATVTALHGTTQADAALQLCLVQHRASDPGQDAGDSC